MRGFSKGRERVTAWITQKATVLVFLHVLINIVGVSNLIIFPISLPGLHVEETRIPLSFTKIEYISKSS